jgi:undecaprenyl-diphosphatase
MSLILVLILAVVQGITEFLPISSDGHLVVVTALYSALSGEPVPKNLLEVEIILHAGTLLAVVIVFWRHLARLLTVDRRVIGLLVVGTLPALTAGYLMKRYLQPQLESPLAAGIGLILTGLILIWAQRRCCGSGDYPSLTYRQALIIGLFQAAAPLPGVSRSGTTIASGVALCGLSPRAAADFSFLLSVPIIGAAVAAETLDLARSGVSSGTPLDILAIGATVSLVVGVFALRFLILWLRRGRLVDFAWWVIPLGIAVVVWQVARPS